MYCLPFQAPQYSHFTPSTRRSRPILSTRSSTGGSSPSAISCMAMGDSTLMSDGGRLAARSVISFTYTPSHGIDSISNFSPGAFFCAHSFMAATATPP